MQRGQIEFLRVTVQTDNKTKNKPNQDAAQKKNKVSWGHSTDNEIKNKPNWDAAQINKVS